MINEISESGADAESSETKGIVATPEVATSPRPFSIYRPKRKRAFHRALKRGELWAVSEAQMTRIMRVWMQDFYRGALGQSLFTGLEKQFEEAKK